MRPPRRWAFMTAGWGAAALLVGLFMYAQDRPPDAASNPEGAAEAETAEPPAAPEPAANPGTDQATADAARDDPQEPADTAVYEPNTEFTESDLGIPVYAGARPLDGGTWRLTDSLSEGAESISTLRLRTGDPYEQVAGFYRQRLRPETTQTFEIDGPAGKTLSLTTESEIYASANIILKQRRDGTHIEINLMGRKPDIKKKIISEIRTD